MSTRLYNLVNTDELKARMVASDEARTTLSFYRYHLIEHPWQFRDQLFCDWSKIGVLGRVYIAQEGINGQISVPTEKLELFKEAIFSIPFLDGVRLNIALDDDGKSFFKLKIKVREKIVADNLDDETFDVTKRGKHLSAAEVNALMEQEDTIVVDMRNHYESEVGYFEGAIRPDVDTFREALPKVEEMLAEDKDKPIIMYCTGGIRCEKASAYYLHKGFEHVHMVDGGIIEYARQCRALGLENKYIGKNFVFDERLGERISEDVVARCHQCGQPCDDHTNCANNACHILFIQCRACAATYANCCSTECKEFAALPEEERDRLRPSRQFNGIKFGKGRYRTKRHRQTVLK